MADPIVTVSERLAPAFAKVAGSGAPTVDPVVRRSDRADAQVNGSLALAKQVGKSPREVAQAVMDLADLSDICSAVEIAGPGFVNLTFSNEFLAAELARCRRSSFGCTTSHNTSHCRRRLFGAKCGQRNTLGTCVQR